MRMHNLNTNHTGKPAPLYECDNPDWVPSQMMGYSVAVPDQAPERYARCKRRKTEVQVEGQSVETGICMHKYDYNNCIF